MSVGVLSLYPALNLEPFHVFLTLCEYHAAVDILPLKKDRRVE
jgi:hypothetical protein